MSQPIPLAEFLANNHSFSKKTLGLQLAWDSTSLGSFKTCPRKYQLSVLLGWRHRHEATPLTFGIHIHAGLETYHKSRAGGADHAASQRAALRHVLLASAGWISDDSYRNRSTLARTLCWYLEQFRDDQATTVILADGKPAVELSFRFEYPTQSAQGEQFLLCGHLDRVIEFAGQRWVSDYKTTKWALDDRFFSQFSPHNQMSLYSLAGRVVFDQPVRGVLIDGIQIQVNASRFSRGFANRTEDQLEEWFEDIRHWLALAERYASEARWPMNDSACGMYGGCTFQGICSKSPKVRDSFLQADFHQVPWDPMIPRN